MTIRVNVTKDTKNITLHAVDMKILQAETTLKEVYSNSNITKWLKILEQANDTAREFYIVKTGETLKAGKQYVVTLKFIGYLNDYLQGFYRSSYTVGNKTRY